MSLNSGLCRAAARFPTLRIIGVGRDENMDVDTPTICTPQAVRKYIENRAYVGENANVLSLIGLWGQKLGRGSCTLDERNPECQIKLEHNRGGRWHYLIVSLPSVSLILLRWHFDLKCLRPLDWTCFQP